MDDYKRKLVYGFIIGLCMVGAVAAMDDIGDLDEVEGNAVDALAGSLGHWIKRNPEKLQAVAEELIKMVLEYKELTSGSN